MTVPVGDLVVRITADTAPLKAGIAEATGSVENFGRVSRTEFRQERALDAMVIGLGNVTSGAQGAAAGIAGLANSFRILTLSQPQLFALVSVIGLIAAGWQAVKRNTDDATESANRYIGKNEEILRGLLANIRAEQALLPAAPTLTAAHMISTPVGPVRVETTTTGGGTPEQEQRRARLAQMEAEIQEALGRIALNARLRGHDAGRQLVQGMQEGIHESITSALPDETKAKKPSGALTEAFIGGAFSEAKEPMQQFINLGKEVQSTIKGIVDAFAKGLATGSFKAFFNGLLGTVGQGLERFGEALIAQGIGVKAMLASISNPFAAIAAGTALVALGAALSAAASASANSLSGGGSFASASSLPTASQGSATFIFPTGGVFDPSNPNQVDAFVKMMQSVLGRNIIIQRGG